MKPLLYTHVIIIYPNTLISIHYNALYRHHISIIPTPFTDVFPINIGIIKYIRIAYSVYILGTHYYNVGKTMP